MLLKGVLCLGLKDRRSSFRPLEYLYENAPLQMQKNHLLSLLPSHSRLIRPRPTNLTLVRMSFTIPRSHQ